MYILSWQPLPINNAFFNVSLFLILYIHAFEYLNPAIFLILYCFPLKPPFLEQILQFRINLQLPLAFVVVERESDRGVVHVTPDVGEGVVHEGGVVKVRGEQTGQVVEVHSEELLGLLLHHSINIEGDKSLNLIWEGVFID